MVQQAGAIVFRHDGSDTQFLLVRARRDPTVWIFPKGHIENGETPEQTAAREAAEEAGVIARVVSSVGALEFEAWGRRLHVEYFLAEYRGTTLDSEGRPCVWGTYDETRERLSFENARDLLAAAQVLLQS